MNITRDVVTDLWPLYASGDLSPDSRALVDEFLAGDGDFARTLREAGSAPLTLPPPPSLPPDHEVRSLDRIKRRLRGPVWLLQLAITFSCFAFGRIIADTSWDVSPRGFIVTAAIAAGFWSAFCIMLYRGRQSVLIGTPSRRAERTSGRD